MNKSSYQIDKNRITIENVMALRPCLTLDNISDYFNGRDYVTYVDVIENNSIIDSYKLWLLCHCLSKSEKASFALKCAEDALPLFEAVYPEDNRPRSAIEAAKRCIAGQCTNCEVESLYIRPIMVSHGPRGGVASNVIKVIYNAVRASMAVHTGSDFLLHSLALDTATYAENISPSLRNGGGVRILKDMLDFYVS